MNLQNSPQNDGGNDDGVNKASEEEKSRRRNEIQREMVMQESDYKKMISEKTLLEAEIRKLRKDAERIKINILEKQEVLNKKSYEVVQAEALVHALKKKLNLI